MAAVSPPSEYLLTASGVQGHRLVLLNPGHADFLGHTAGSGGCLRPRDRPGTSPSVKRQRPPPTAFAPPPAPHCTTRRLSPLTLAATIFFYKGSCGSGKVTNLPPNTSPVYWLGLNPPKQSDLQSLAWNRSTHCPF